MLSWASRPGTSRPWGWLLVCFLSEPTDWLLRLPARSQTRQLSPLRLLRSRLTSARSSLRRAMLRPAPIRAPHRSAGTGPPWWMPARASLHIAVKEYAPWSPRGPRGPWLALRSRPSRSRLARRLHRIALGASRWCVLAPHAGRPDRRSSPPPLSLPRLPRGACAQLRSRAPQPDRRRSLRCISLPDGLSPGLSGHSGGGSLPPALPVVGSLLQHCLTGVTLSSSASSPPRAPRCREARDVEDPRRSCDALSDSLQAAEVFSGRSSVRCPAPENSKSAAPAKAGEVVGNLDLSRFPDLGRPERCDAPRPFKGPLRPCLAFPVALVRPVCARSRSLAGLLTLRCTSVSPLRRGRFAGDAVAGSPGEPKPIRASLRAVLRLRGAVRSMVQVALRHRGLRVAPTSRRAPSRRHGAGPCGSVRPATRWLAPASVTPLLAACAPTQRLPSALTRTNSRRRQCVARCRT